MRALQKKTHEEEKGWSVVIRDCFVASRAVPTELRVCGGGASSSIWCPMSADVTGVPTIRFSDRTVGAKGAFICALVATGAESNFAHAAHSYNKARDLFVPDQNRSARDTQMYQEFLEMRDIAAKGWQRLVDARARMSES
jgi:erythritol kinase